MKKIEYQKNDYLGRKNFYRDIEAKEDCALPRVRRFLQNWNEKSVVRKVERKNFFSR